MALTQITTKSITDGTVATADIADQAVTLDKLPHGTSSNDGKFLRANNGADPTFETIVLDNSKITKDVTLASGASTTNSKVINLNTLGQVGVLPQMSTIGTFVTDSNYHPEPGNADGTFITGSASTTSPDHHGYLYPDATLVHRHTSTNTQSSAQTAGVRYSKTGSAYRVRFSSVFASNIATMTIVSELLNADGTVTASSTTQTVSTTSDSYNSRHECTVQQWKDDYWVAVVRSCRDNVGSSSRYHRMSLQMFTVNPSTGAISLLGTKHDEAFNNRRGNFYDDENSGVTEVQLRWNCAAIRMGRMATRGIQLIFFKYTTSGAVSYTHLTLPTKRIV